MIRRGTTSSEAFQPFFFDFARGQPHPHPLFEPFFLGNWSLYFSSYSPAFPRNVFTPPLLIDVRRFSTVFQACRHVFLGPFWREVFLALKDLSGRESSSSFRNPSPPRRRNHSISSLFTGMPVATPQNPHLSLVPKLLTVLNPLVEFRHCARNSSQLTCGWDFFLPTFPVRLLLEPLQQSVTSRTCFLFVFC